MTSAHRRKRPLRSRDWTTTTSTSNEGSPLACLVSAGPSKHSGWLGGNALLGQIDGQPVEVGQQCQDSARSFTDSAPPLGFIHRLRGFVTAVALRFPCGELLCQGLFADPQLCDRDTKRDAVAIATNLQGLVSA